MKAGGDLRAGGAAASAAAGHLPEEAPRRREVQHFERHELHDAPRRLLRGENVASEALGMLR